MPKPHRLPLDRPLSDGPRVRLCLQAGHWLLDQDQSVAECEEVRAYLETYTALVGRLENAAYRALVAVAGQN